MSSAASAASGRTDTPSAARSGEIAKPATSSITSRNSTAVNAAAVSASPASSVRSAGGASSASRTGRRERDERRGERDRCLDGEDRAPVEQLGQHAADRRPRGGADERGGQPQPPPGARLARVQHRVRGQQRGGGARRLQRPEHQQHPQRRRDRAADRRGREHEQPDRAGAHPARGQDRHREHERVDGDDRRHAGDRRVELDQQRRQRERHDRGVGQCQRRRDRDERASKSRHTPVSLCGPLEVQDRELGRSRRGGGVGAAPLGRPRVDLARAIERVAAAAPTAPSCPLRRVRAERA